MQEPRFSIPSALSLLYGIARPVTFPGIAEAAQQEAPQVSFAGIQVVPDDQVQPMSSISTPILYPITFKGGVLKRYATDGRVEQVEMGELRLPVSSVVEMSTTKTVTKTQVSASSGSVKEVYGFGDWDIRISGIMLDEANHPNDATTIEAMEERLLEFERLAYSIGVTAPLFNRRGIERLVIRSVNFSQLPGRPRMIGFQMQCDSDAAIELLIQ